MPSIAIRPARAEYHEALKRLCSVNRSFDRLLRRLQALDDCPLLKTKPVHTSLKRSRATLNETQAWINFELLEVLRDFEEREWTRLGIASQRSRRKQNKSD